MSPAEAIPSTSSLPVPEVVRIALTTTIYGATLALIAATSHYVTADLGDRVRRQRLAT